MLTRLSALALVLAVTVSGAWSPSFLTFFPIMAPVAILLLSRRSRSDPIALVLLSVGTAAALSAVATGANLGFGLLWLTLAGLYVVARQHLSQVVSPQIFVRGMVVVVAAVCVLAMYQVVTTTTFGSPYKVYGSQMQLGLTTSGNALVQRPVGVFHNSNVLGQWLAFATLMLAPSWRLLPRLPRWVTGALVVATLGLTYSRAVWAVVAVMAAIFVFRWIARSPTRVGVGLVAVGMGGIAVLPTGTPSLPTNVLPERFGIEEALTQWGERSSLNTLGLEVARENPLFGVGYLQYAGSNEYLRPHNVFVQVAAEQGYPVAILLGVAVAVVAASCWRSGSQVRREKPILAASLAALPVAWFSFLVTYSSAGDFAVMPIMILTLGLLLAQADRTHDGAFSSGSGRHAGLNGPVRERRAYAYLG